jgi:hypothetical protein
MTFAVLTSIPSGSKARISKNLKKKLGQIYPRPFP